LALSAALRGAGISVLPAFFCAEAVRTGLLAPVLEDWSAGRAEIHVVYSGSRHLSARVRLFVDALIDRFTALPPWLLSPDGRAFVIDETHTTSAAALDGTDARSRPVFDSIETALRAQAVRGA